MSDVWPIYELVYGKVPLLDEKDMEKVSEEDKNKFEKKFEIRHDIFYERYSENVFEAYKRLLR